MKLSFKFSNLCGAVYKQGNIVFSRDGNSVYSPVGNRVTQFDLKNNKARTFPFENAKNIHRVGISPDGVLMITVDEEGAALLVSLLRGVVLHAYNFKRPVYDLQFSPDGRYFAVTHSNKIQVWHVPGAVKSFAPFVLFREFPGQYDETLCLDWSEDSRFLCVGSRDMSCRVFSLHAVPGFHYCTMAGHRSRLVLAAFQHQSLDVYTVSKDGAVIVWTCSLSMEEVEQRVATATQNKRRKVASDGSPSGDSHDNRTEHGSHSGRGSPEGPGPLDEQSGDSEEDEPSLPPRKRDVNLCLWKKTNKFLFKQEFSTVSCAHYHKPRGLLVVGFATGVFTIHEMPEFNLIHSLSVSQQKVTTVTVSPSGEWLALGCSSHGQLLVWEWSSETYVLRQQGHHYDMNCLAHSPDGHVVATGGDDGKLKLWDTSSSFCFRTFSEHSSPVTDVCFGSSGHVVVSASLDGTVRAFDMIRYKNFCTLATPRPVQLSCVALDPSGEVVCAGSRDTFQLFLWSLQRKALLEVLSGHEAPISALRFNPHKSQLISCSWDKTVRVWSVFGEKGASDSVRLSADALALAVRPDGAGLAVSTLDGVITLWDAELAPVGSIEGRRDLGAGRRVEDKVTAASLAAGVAFYSLCYSADGSCLLAGGRSKYICLYSCQHQVLLKRFLVSRNRSLDGMRRYLNSAHMTEAGPLALLSEDEDSDQERTPALPGVAKGDLSSRKTRPVMAVHALEFSPTGESFSAVTTEGLLIFSLDQGAVFTPYDLTVDVTPEAVRQASLRGDHLSAIVLAFRLSDHSLVTKAMELVAIGDVPLMAANFPRPYLDRMLRLLSSQVDRSPHLQFYLVWSASLLSQHGSWVKSQSRELFAALTSLQRTLAAQEKALCQLVERNTYFLDFLTIADV